MFPPPRLYPTDLSDAEWAILAPPLPPSQPCGRPPKWPLRLLLDGIFYVLRSGCQWRLLPREFPPWQTVHHYFRRWHLDGTWERLNGGLRDQEGIVGRC
jgi:putative transposase